MSVYGKPVSALISQAPVLKIMPSTKHGSSSGGGEDPFKNNTPGSMSKKLKEPKKKRGDPKKREEEQTQVRLHSAALRPHVRSFLLA